MKGERERKEDAEVPEERTGIRKESIVTSTLPLLSIDSMPDTVLKPHRNLKTNKAPFYCYCLCKKKKSNAFLDTHLCHL